MGVTDPWVPGGRWGPRLLLLVSVVCLVVATAVLVGGWRWTDPPEADVIPVPPTPPRQLEAFGVISQWLAAQDRGDAAAMRALTCATPPPELAGWISMIEREGNDQGLFFPEVIRDFRDTGSVITAEVALRVRPLDDRMRRLVEAEQDQGGFFFNQFTLIEEGGLKVCQSDIPER